MYFENATISSVKDVSGKIVSYIAVKEDVTERILREQQLKNALSEFEAIFSNSSMGIALLKDNRKIHRVNSRLLDMFGYEENELMGKSIRLLHLSEEWYGEVGRHYTQSLATGEVVQMECEMRHKDGKGMWCGIHGKAIDPGHVDAGVIWVFDDISERKNLEELRVSVENIMRHDLKTPLNGIIGLPQLMLLDDNLTEQQISYLTAIEDAGYRMLHQVNLSLDLFRVEMGQYAFQPVPVDICAVITKIHQDLAAKAKEKDIALEMLSGGCKIETRESLFVSAEEPLCYSMLSNIIANAIEASPQSACVTVDLEKHEQVGVLVHNQGQVPEAIQKVFFDKFATHGKEKGTGLGTYSARLMAEIQGGSIAMRTSKEEGTTVSIFLQRSTMM